MAQIDLKHIFAILYIFSTSKSVAQTDLKHMNEDIEMLKNDVAVIKHILSEEGELTNEAKRRLEAARKTPSSKYVKI